MDYPEAHADDLLEVFPGPVGEKSLNPRQSYKVSQEMFCRVIFLEKFSSNKLLCYVFRSIGKL